MSEQSSVNQFSIDGPGLRQALEAQVACPDLGQLQAAAAAPQSDAHRGLICGAVVWCGYAAPAGVMPVWDALAAGVIGAGDVPAAQEIEAAPLPDAFWSAFAEVLTGPPGGYDALTITAAVASLGGEVSDHFGVLAERAALAHPGADQAQSKSVPQHLSMTQLAALPAQSLGHTLYRMLIENGFDPEVLDRDAIGLQHLPPALRYLNTRILQMHDVWHLMAGYETTSLHEIAISAFQLAQFGHNYSSMFLAMVLTRSHLSGGLGFELLLRSMAEAWQHGRSNPCFMAIEFEQEWHDPIEVIRARHGISPYQGSFPANLLEQLGAQAT